MQGVCRFRRLFFLLLLQVFIGNYSQAISNKVALEFISVIDDAVMSEDSLQEIDYDDVGHRVCAGAIKPYCLTIIEEIKKLETCCDVLQSKIDHINVVASADLTPVTSQLDVCCSAIDNQLGVIESKIDNITVSASVDLTPVTSKLDVCCSAIDNQLGIIDSKIDNISVSASVDLTPITSKLDVCCSAIDNQLGVIDSKLDVIDSKIDAATAPCAAQPILAPGSIPTVVPTAITGSVVITEPGIYCLTKDIVVTSTGSVGITVSASDVVLDLNGHTVTATDYADGIQIDAGRTNLVVKNGFIRGGASLPGRYGINVAGTLGNMAKKVQIENLMIDTFSVAGINAAYATKLTVRECEVSDVAAGSAFFMQSTKDSSIENSEALTCDVGFTVSACTSVILFNNVADQNRVGFLDLYNLGALQIRGCTASYNTDYGFQYTGGSTLARYYFGNVAIQNGATPAQGPNDTNYNVVFPYPGGAPFYWIVTPSNITDGNDNMTA